MLLAPLLAEAGVGPDAVEVVFTGLDRGVEGGEAQHYERALSLGDTENALLAYEMNGAPVPPQHGFPLRLFVPGWYGMTNVKWLTRIALLEQPFEGFQNAVAYRMSTPTRAGESGPAWRPLVDVPPGVPTSSHVSATSAGPVALTGRAGRASPRSSASRCPPTAAPRLGARAGRALGEAAWRGWRFDWDAPAGEHVLCSRATDAAGNTQPLEAPWNLKGYANNAVEQVVVVVHADA